MWEETSEDCAPRRLNDELEIKGLDCALRGQIEYQAKVGDDMLEHEVVDVFVAHAPDDLQLTLNPDEVCSTRWITPRDLQLELAENPQNFTPWLHIYMTKHFDTILGSK